MRATPKWNEELPLVPQRRPPAPRRYEIVIDKSDPIDLMIKRPLRPIQKTPGYTRKFYEIHGTPLREDELMEYAADYSPEAIVMAANGDLSRIGDAYWPPTYLGFSFSDLNPVKQVKRLAKGTYKAAKKGAKGAYKGIKRGIRGIADATKYVGKLSVRGFNELARAIASGAATPIRMAFKYKVGRPRAKAIAKSKGHRRPTKQDKKEAVQWGFRKMRQKMGPLGSLAVKILKYTRGVSLTGIQGHHTPMHSHYSGIYGYSHIGAVDPATITTVSASITASISLMVKGLDFYEDLVKAKEKFDEIKEDVKKEVDAAKDLYKKGKKIYDRGKKHYERGKQIAEQGLEAVKHGRVEANIEIDTGVNMQARGKAAARTGARMQLAAKKRYRRAQRQYVNAQPVPGQVPPGRVPGYQRRPSPPVTSYPQQPMYPPSQYGPPSYPGSYYAAHQPAQQYYQPGYASAPYYPQSFAPPDSLYTAPIAPPRPQIRQIPGTTPGNALYMQNSWQYQARRSPNPYGY